jgi:tRNA (guanine6-N2)-methyltransferase
MLARTVTNKYRWTYTERDHSNFDIRLFVDHDELYVAVKCWQRSLYERAYKTSQRQGSLRPSIAAAMVQLAAGVDMESGTRIVDNFCGSGTILAESLLAGSQQVYGGDIERQAVDFTRQNLSNLHYSETYRIKQLDATKTKWPPRFFDSAVSNLPWGRQIGVSHVTSLYRDTLHEYARILRPNGVLCLLVGRKYQLIAKYAKQAWPGVTLRTYQLAYLGQSPMILLIKPN